MHTHKGTYLRVVRRVAVKEDKAKDGKDGDHHKDSDCHADDGTNRLTNLRGLVAGKVVEVHHVDNPSQASEAERMRVGKGYRQIHQIRHQRDDQQNVEPVDCQSG